MFCSKCAYELPNGSNFCFKCGTPLDSRNIEQAAESAKKMHSHSAMEERPFRIAARGMVKQQLIRRWVNLIQVIFGIGLVVACLVMGNYSKQLINHVPVINRQFMARDDVILMNGDIENATLAILILGILAGILLTKGLGGLFRK